MIGEGRPITGLNEPNRRQVMRGAAALGVAALSGYPAWAQTGKTLRIAIPNNPTTIDPINNVGHDSMVLGATVFENLVEMDANGDLRPQLAIKMPDISEGGTIYDFDLRTDVYFQNGQKLTAEDVKYSFDYTIDPKNKAGRRSLFTRIKNITAVSPTRVRFELSEPYAPWLYFLTKYMAIVPNGSRDKHGQDFFKNGPVGVGTGPGIFEEWHPNDYVSFKKFDGYWRKGFPRWDRLVVRIIPDDAARVAYLQTGEIDILGGAPPSDFARLKALPGLAGGSRPTLGGFLMISTNNLKPPFDDVNFRKAVACAIDRKSIADQVFFGLMDPMTAPCSPRAWWYSKSADSVLQYNPDKAREYLKKSKYPNGATFDMLVPSEAYILDSREAAVAAQAQLAKLNIHANLRPTETAVMLSTMIKGDHTATFTTLMSPGEATYLIAVCYTAGQPFTKSSNYTHPEVNDLLRQSYTTLDRDKLLPIYDKLLNRLVEDSPHIWLGTAHAANLWRSNVKNFVPSQGLTMIVADVAV